MNMTTSQLIGAAIVAAIAYHLGKKAGAAPAKTTTSTGSLGIGNGAGPEWWSYAGSWQ